MMAEPTPNVTPRPWAIDLNGINGCVASIGPVYGYDYGRLEGNLADAEYIVRCVNSHEELVAAVGALLDDVFEQGQTDFGAGLHPQVCTMCDGDGDKSDHSLGCPIIALQKAYANATEGEKP